MALERKYARQAQKIDTEEKWGKAVNFVPEKGEIIVYSKDALHLKDRIKIGDGVTKINELGFVNPGRELRAGPLTKQEEAKLSSITVEQARSFLRSDQAKLDNNLEGLSQWLYEQAGIDFNGYVNSIEKTFKRVFDKNYKLLNDNETDPQTKAMILDKSYGGAGIKMLANGYKYDLELSNYKIGDIFCARYHDYDLNSDNCYYMAFYQGDNNFLLYNDFGGDVQETELSTFEVVSYSWIATFIRKTMSDSKLYSIYYYVLRPQNIATIDVDKLKEEVEISTQSIENLTSLRRLRNLNEGKLTEVEKDRLSNLKTIRYSGNQLPGGAIDLYYELNIDVSEYFKDNINTIARKLFDIDNSFQEREGDSYYHTMLVPRSWGGSGFVEKNQPVYTIAMSDYQIGDIFCGRYLNPETRANVYWAAFYKGNNQFIIRDSSKNTFINTYNNISTIYNTKEWKYYYILRPERLVIEDTLKLQEYTVGQVEEIYEKINNEVDSLALKKADTTRAKEGTLIISSDCGITPLKELNVYGKTTHLTTTGKNLFDFNSGVSNIEHLPAGTYTITGSGLSNDGNNEIFFDQFGIVVTDAKGKEKPKAIVSEESDWDSYTCTTIITIEDGDIIKIKNHYDGNNIADFNVQLTGDISEPNPYYPLELVNIGNSGSIDITVCGKNLISPEAISKHLYNVRAWYPEGKILPAGTYTASINVTCLGIYANDPRTSTRYALVYGSNKLTFTLTEPSPVHLDFYTEPMPEDAWKSAMLEIGSTASPYEPYSGSSLTVSTPTGLAGLPISSGGNYLDDKGQRWICDEIDFARGVYVQRIGKLDAGSLNWTYRSNEKIFSSSVFSPASIYNSKGFCSHYSVVTGKSYTNLLDKEMFIRNSGFSANSVLLVKDISYTNTEAFKAAMVGVEVLYELETPIEIPLPVEEKISYRALRTQSPITTIHNDVGAHMSAVYYTHSTAVPMVFTPEDHGRTFEIDNDGCVTLGRNIGEIELISDRVSNRYFGQLTEWQISTLSEIEPYSHNKWTPGDFFRFVYTKIKIDLGQLSSGTVQDYFNNKLLSGMWVDRQGEVGTKHTTSPTEALLKVGDIFLGRQTNEGNKYYMALYQGNGQWLIDRQNSSTTNSMEIVKEDITAGYDGIKNWCYYTIYRPEKVLRNLQGLGTEVQQYAEKLDETLISGWYRALAPSGIGFTSGAQGLLLVESINENTKKQTFFEIVSTNACRIASRYYYNSNWGSWQQVNNFVTNLSVPYQTNELYGTVTVKTISIKVALPAASASNKTLTISGLGSGTVLRHATNYQSFIKNITISNNTITIVPSSISTGVNSAIIQIWYY